MTPAFIRNLDGSWRPGPLARGPFDGVQGGAVAGLMAAEIVARFDGVPASLTTHFLKVAPLAPLKVTVRPLRTGRRVRVIDADLSGPSGLVAVQRMTLITPRADGGLPTPPLRPAQPETLPAQARAAPHGGPWFMDAMEVRGDATGPIWFRQHTPLFDGAPALTRVLAAADWAHGLTAPLGCDIRPPAAIPNTDLAVHLLRQPVGEWIGLEPATAWSAGSIGLGWAELRDTSGLLGRVAMSVAVELLAEAVA